MSFSFRELLDTANTWKDIANDGNLISVYKSEVYWAAIKPRLDRNKLYCMKTRILPQQTADSV